LKKLEKKMINTKKISERFSKRINEKKQREIGCK